MSDKTRTIGIDDDLHGRIRDKCKAEGRVMRRWIEEALEGALRATRGDSSPSTVLTTQSAPNVSEASRNGD